MKPNLSRKISFKHLTHFVPLAPFYTPWKQQKTIGFRSNNVFFFGGGGVGLQKETCGQPIFLNPQTKLNFSSSEHNVYSLPSNTITEKCTTIKDLCRLGFPLLHQRIRVEKKLGHTYPNSERTYIRIT